VSRDNGFRHEAFFYSGQAELLDGATAFATAAMTTGEPVLVALQSEEIAELRTRLGDTAREVFYADMSVLGRNPARIIPAWRSFVEDNAPTAPGLRGIGQPIWAGRDPAELVECRHHEALINLAFDDPDMTGGRPFWLMCPYDTSSLDPAVVDEARGTHPLLRTNGHAEPSDRYRDIAPAELFGEPLPEPRAPAVELVFGRALVRLRRFVSEQALRVVEPAVLDRRSLMDIVLAVEELGANSVRYGGGGGRVRIWRENRTLLCEVSDQGHITDPLAGRRQPAKKQIGGRGLWMVNQLCDLVQLRSSAAGTVTRLHIRLT
jgi:anti-sigma regulatory factor (Ser/Thr protein kinase)